MKQKRFKIHGKIVETVSVNVGPFCIVFAYTAEGMLGCGAFDVEALERFHYPAVRIRSRTGEPIVTAQDLLGGVVAQANPRARQRGIQEEMSAEEAVSLL